MLLHQRRLDPDLLRRLVAEHALENETLEFKACWWRDVHEELERRNDADNSTRKVRRITKSAKEEAGKDVAALANALGGDIVIGIQEDPQTGAAGKFADHPCIPGEFEHELRQMLLKSMVPPDVANTILTDLVTIPGGGGAVHQVLVISVPPWHHGSVAVRRSEGFGAFMFPSRTGRHTYPMEMDEVLTRTEAGNRSAYIKLRALVGDGRRDVLFASPVQWDGPGFRVDVPITERHGRITDVGDACVHVDMYEVPVTRERARIAIARDLTPRQRGVTAAQIRVEHIPHECIAEADQIVCKWLERYSSTLVIPISLIHEAWETAPTTPVHLLVRGTVKLVAGRWLVTTAATAR